MIRSLATSAAAICLMTSTAFAEPTIMTDAQMESQVAGDGHARIETTSGREVWSLVGDGANNGGNGRTANAAGGLLGAVDAGGLVCVGC